MRSLQSKSVQPYLLPILMTITGNDLGLQVAEASKSGSQDVTNPAAGLTADPMNVLLASSFQTPDRVIKWADELNTIVSQYPPEVLDRIYKVLNTRNEKPGLRDWLIIIKQLASNTGEDGRLAEKLLDFKVAIVNPDFTPNLEKFRQCDKIKVTVGDSSRHARSFTNLPSLEGHLLKYFHKPEHRSHTLMIRSGWRRKRFGWEEFQNSLQYVDGSKALSKMTPPPFTHHNSCPPVLEQDYGQIYTIDNPEWDRLNPQPANVVRLIATFDGLWNTRPEPVSAEKMSREIAALITSFGLLKKHLTTDHCSRPLMDVSSFANLLAHVVHYRNMIGCALPEGWLKEKCWDECRTEVEDALAQISRPGFEPTFKSNDLHQMIALLDVPEADRGSEFKSLASLFFDIHYAVENLRVRIDAKGNPGTVLDRSLKDRVREVAAAFSRAVMNLRQVVTTEELINLSEAAKNVAKEAGRPEVRQYAEAVASYATGLMPEILESRNRWPEYACMASSTNKKQTHEHIKKYQRVVRDNLLSKFRENKEMNREIISVLETGQEFSVEHPSLSKYCKSDPGCRLDLELLVNLGIADRLMSKASLTEDEQMTLNDKLHTILYTDYEIEAPAPYFLKVGGITIDDRERLSGSRAEEYLKRYHPSALRLMDDHHALQEKVKSLPASIKYHTLVLKIMEMYGQLRQLQSRVPSRAPPAMHISNINDSVNDSVDNSERIHSIMTMLEESPSEKVFKNPKWVKNTLKELEKLKVIPPTHTSQPHAIASVLGEAVRKYKEAQQGQEEASETGYFIHSPGPIRPANAFDHLYRSHDPQASRYILALMSIKNIQGMMEGNAKLWGRLNTVRNSPYAFVQSLLDIADEHANASDSDAAREYKDQPYFALIPCVELDDNNNGSWKAMKTALMSKSDTAEYILLNGSFSKVKLPEEARGNTNTIGINGYLYKIALSKDKVSAACRLLDCTPKLYMGLEYILFPGDFSIEECVQSFTRCAADLIKESFRDNKGGADKPVTLMIVVDDVDFKIQCKEVNGSITITHFESVEFRNLSQHTSSVPGSLGYNWVRAINGRIEEARQGLTLAQFDKALCDLIVKDVGPIAPLKMFEPLRGVKETSV